MKMENKLSNTTFGLNIILLTTISSISLSLHDNNKTIMPTTTATYQSISGDKHPWDMEKPAYIQVSTDSDKDDFEVISSFAQRIVSQSKDIDDEIQEVINNHFWEML